MKVQIPLAVLSNSVYITILFVFLDGVGIRDNEGEA